MTACAEYYPDEKTRQIKIAPILEAFLGDYAATETSCHSDTVTFNPDGCLRAKCGLYRDGEAGRRAMCKFIFELEAGIGSGSCDPSEQAQQDFLLVCINSSVRSLHLSSLSYISDLFCSWINFVECRVCQHSCFRWQVHT
jgi:hypothetical protein